MHLPIERINDCGVRLSVCVWSGTSRTEKLDEFPFSGCSRLLTQLTTHMFLYQCSYLSPKAPRIYHNIFHIFRPLPVQTYSQSLNRLMATASRQPPWQQPTAPDADLPRLVVYNSLTRSKVPFVPIDWKTKKVLWYNCGPTT